MSTLITAPSAPPASSRAPRRAGHRAWRWAAPAALLAAGGLYVAWSVAQSEQPYLDQPIGWTTRPVLSSNDLSSGKEVVFRPEFNKTTGGGYLFANHISASGTVLSTSPWTNVDAGVLLKSQHPFNGRRVFTVNASGTAVPFVWGSLNDTQKAALGNATTGPQVLAYLRGDASNEGNGAGQFRIRSTPLGSITHSSLLHWVHSWEKAGSPVPDVQERLYVGANDGMLHVFDAKDGKELFAYVPSMLIPRLAPLAQPGYKPQAYVNGPLDMANITDQGKTRSILAGGLGSGGKGLFALDVSAQSFASDTDAAKTLLWEISPSRSGFGNLGYTYAMPRLTRLDDGTAAVVVGNGYRSDSGKATLLVINALTGALIREIDTGVGSTSNRNGLSTPTLLDTNKDRRIDTAYAGDLQGNLWRFNLTTGTKTKLFTTSPAQAITTAPALTAHPITGQLVMFGTGQALVEGDLKDTSVHAVYGIWDDNKDTTTVNASELLTQTVSEVVIGGKRWRSTSSNDINWDIPTKALHKGWKLSLPAGERVLGEPPFVTENRFVFASMNPTTPSTASSGPGENWMTQISVFTGGNFSSSIFDVNGDGKVNDADKDNGKADGKVLNGRYMADGVVSQPVLIDMTSLSSTLFNYNPEISITTTTTPGSTNTSTVVDTKVSTTPPITVPGGVSNGHFDIDIYYGGKNQSHTHEYDDKFNVVGVNFLAPSQAEYNVSKAIPGAGTEFKVLVVNQYLNPASLLRVGGSDGYVSVKDFQGQASAANANFVTSLPVFRRNNIGAFVWKLPVDAFQSKDWWGDGGVRRAGLIPTQTGCVNKGFNNTPGRNGEIYNGSLTLQLIKPGTPASALELNYPAGGPKYGWRVKAANRASYLLGEYTMFWHHPNGVCYNQNGWVPNPPQDPSRGKTQTPDKGASDPTSIFNPPVDGPVTIVKTEVSTNGNVTTTVDTFSDGSTRTTIETRTEVITIIPGSTTTIVTDRNGTKVEDPKKLCIGGTNIVTGEPCKCIDGTDPPCGGPRQDPFQDGRFSWRELRTSN